MMERLLEQLCGLSGVSGQEQQVRDFILAQVQPYGDCTVDALGNLLVFKRGKNPAKKKLLLSAHMDEVGLIVTYIEESGLLRFAAVGGVDARILPAKAVTIGENHVHGVVCTKAVHQMTDEDKKSAPSISGMVLDIGAKNREEAEKLVQLGDGVTIEGTFTKMGNLLRGRGLDDRLGCGILIRLIQSELPYDVHFAFTTMEEVGCLGAKTAAYAIQPDIGIAMETTTASDIPISKPHETVCSLGKGPVVSFMDKGTIYDRTLYKKTLALAKEQNIPYQTKAGVFGGNESRSVQTTGAGAAVLAVSVASRYLHTPSCTVSPADIDNTEKLLRAMIAAEAGV